MSFSSEHAFARVYLRSVGVEMKKHFPSVNQVKNVGVLDSGRDHYTVEIVFEGKREEFYVQAMSRTEARAKGYESFMRAHGAVGE